MKNRILTAILSICLIAPAFCFATPASALSKPTITLNGATYRTATSATGNKITGTVSIAKGQRVALYTGKGKGLRADRMPNTGGKASFSLTVPTLSPGENEFIVRSEPNGSLSASKLKLVVFVYNPIKTTYTSYTFPSASGTVNLGVKATGASYSSSNPKVATASKGIVTAKGAGTTTITIKQGSVSKKVKITVPKVNTRDQALKPWYDAMKKQASESANSIYDWGGWARGGYTIAASRKYGTCITFPSASMQRCGLIREGEYVTAGNGSSLSSSLWSIATRAMNRNGYFTYFRCSSSVSALAKSGKILPGDTMGHATHTYVYMGKAKNGKYYYSEAGRTSSGKRAGTVGSNRATIKGTGGSRTVNWVARIKTFTITTSAKNGTITTSNRYMAGQTVKVSFKPDSGKKVKSITVDGKKISTSKRSYTFSKLNKSHKIVMICE